MAALAQLSDRPALFVARRRAQANVDLWSSVDSLLERIDDLDDLRAHRLHLLAADRWRRRGDTPPPELAEEERVAAVLTLLAPLALQRVRDAYDGMLVLMKGPEAAARYPDPALRPFRDLDVLVDDAPAAQASLLAAGFVETGDPKLYVDIHHLRPLMWPGVPLVVELHARPKWPDWLDAPDPRALLEAAVPGVAGVDGVLALPPEQHALVLAAHSWAHEPLRRLLELVDVAALAAEADADATAALARAWGLRRVWSATSRSIDAVLSGRRRPWTLRTWARNLASGRERTVLESHLGSWFAPFAALPFGSALRVAGAAVATDIRPAPGEGWREKGLRSGRALKNAFLRRSEHDRALAEQAGGRDAERDA